MWSQGFEYIEQWRLLYYALQARRTFGVLGCFPFLVHKFRPWWAEGLPIVVQHAESHKMAQQLRALLDMATAHCNPQPVSVSDSKIHCVVHPFQITLDSLSPLQVMLSELSGLHPIHKSSRGMLVLSGNMLAWQAVPIISNFCSSRTVRQERPNAAPSYSRKVDMFHIPNISACVSGLL